MAEPDPGKGAAIESTEQHRPRTKAVRLFHDREQERPGPVDRRDEQECFTGRGRVVGVWLTTERADGPTALVADVDADDLAGFEVTQPGDPARTFVVPGSVTAGFSFSSCHDA